MLLTIPEDARLEIKFAAYEVHLHKVLNWIEQHPAAFKVPYSNRKVNNVYFDTLNYSAYEQNQSGMSARTKVRYRWYGDSLVPDAGTLEVKCKRNYFGWKLRLPCPDMKVDPADDWNKIRRNLLGQLPPEGRTWLDIYSDPILINRYSRRYFVSHDEKIRVTVDTNQAVWDQRFKPMPNFNRKANIPESLVIEVKFDRKDRDLASNIIQTIPVRVSRHSKYMNGLSAISGI